jgi:hypothetical protein
LIDRDEILSFVHSILSQLSTPVKKAMTETIIGALLSQRFAIASTARKMQGPTKRESKAKRFNRLLNSDGVDPTEVSRRILAHLFPQPTLLSPPIVFATDWTSMGYLSILLTCVVLRDRAVPVFWTVVEGVATADAEEVHLELLAKIRPAGLQAALVADRGFGNVRFMRALEKHNFTYIVRVVGNAKIQSASDEEFWSIDSVAYERGAVQDFGFVDYREKDPHNVRIVRFHSSDSKHKEPWILASQYTWPAEQLIAVYALRFKCEEFNKDFKDVRAGFGLRGYYWEVPQRMARQLVVVAITYIMMVTASRYGVYRSWTIDETPGTTAAWRGGLMHLCDSVRGPAINAQHLLGQMPKLPMRVPTWHCRSNSNVPIHTEWNLAIRKREPKKLTPSNEHIVVARRLLDRIRNSPFTWKEVASKLGVTFTYLHQVLGGNNKVPAYWLPHIYEIFKWNETELFKDIAWRPRCTATVRKRRTQRATA